jgi:hypothetical protein
MLPFISVHPPCIGTFDWSLKSSPTTLQCSETPFSATFLSRFLKTRGLKSVRVTICGSVRCGESLRSQDA